MPVLTQALIWFLFVLVLGILLVAFFIAVATIVKTFCRPTEMPPPEEMTPMEPVPWIMAVAVEVTNPDDTKIMAVHESPA
jgi:flagellar basal body-associated protein FliL